MPKTRRILTRMSKGELSPLLEGSPDLAAYFEGASQLENWKVLRQGGIRRWEGTRFIKEVKDSTKDTILLPFEFSVDDAYILEVGDLYIRVYKNSAPVLVSAGGPQVEIVTPFVVADIREVHFTQSADVLFLFHGSYQQRKLSRVSDTNWTLSAQLVSPPPSFEADTDLISLVAGGANTGNAVPFRAFSAVFLAADVGRQIIAGAAKAVITSVTSTVEVVADILDPFSQTITAGPNTLSTVGTAMTSTAHGLSTSDYVRLTSGAQAGELRRVANVTGVDTATLDAAFSMDQTTETWNRIIGLPSSTWFLRLSPQTTLDPTIRGPVNAPVTLVAGAAAFRVLDVGKYITIYGGVVRITNFDSTIQVRGVIESEMGDTDDVNPAAAPAGSWFLEVAAWSATSGFPRTGDFYQGRLYQASTATQPTTFWGSRADDFDNYAIGVTAEDAIEYTMASRQVNRIEWLADNRFLFLGTTGTEHRALGSSTDNAPIGGDTIPLVERLANNGCAPIQPVAINNVLLYVDRSRRKILKMGFDLDADGFATQELTVGAEHITGTGVRLGPLAFERRLDPRLYVVLDDGTLVGMTFFPEQKVSAFSRRVSGIVQSVAVIAASGGGADQIWMITQRAVDGALKRYVEVFDSALQTDSAITVTGLTGTTVTGLGHLEANDVSVKKNGSYIGDFPVTGGQITLPEDLVAEDDLEIGIPYYSNASTMPPSIPGQVIEGLPRSWDSLFLRLHASKGGEVNGEAILYPPGFLDTVTPFTGDVKVTSQQWNTDGRVTIVQDQPYDMTILAIFGTLSVGDRD